jgi:hypothetical protein
MDPPPTEMSDIDALDTLLGPLETALAQSAEEIAQDLAHATHTDLTHGTIGKLPIMMCQFCHTDFLRSDYFFHVHYPRCKQEVLDDEGDIRNCPCCKVGLYYQNFWEHVETNEECREHWQFMSVVEKKVANPDYLTPEERNVSYAALQREVRGNECGSLQQPVKTEKPSTPPREQCPLRPYTLSDRVALPVRVKVESQEPVSSLKTPTASLKALMPIRGCGIRTTNLDGFPKNHQQQRKDRPTETESSNSNDAQTASLVALCEPTNSLAVSDQRKVGLPSILEGFNITSNSTLQKPDKVTTATSRRIRRHGPFDYSAGGQMSRRRRSARKEQHNNVAPVRRRRGSRRSANK